MATTPAKKPMVYSWTIWTNLIMGIVGVVGIWWSPINDFVTPSALAMLMGFANMVLRFKTKDAVGFWVR